MLRAEGAISSSTTSYKHVEEALKKWESLDGARREESTTCNPEGRETLETG